MTHVFFLLGVTIGVALAVALGVARSIPRSRARGGEVRRGPWDC